MRIPWCVVAIGLAVLVGCDSENGQVGDGESRELFASSLTELNAKTQAHEGLFQISQADWDLDQDAGKIKFTSPDGKIVTAPAQVAGTFDTADSTWLWSWDNPSIDEKLTAHALLAKDFGGGHGPDELIRRKFKTTEDWCWKYTAVTCKLGKYEGAYRARSDGTIVFVTFGEVTIEKPQ